MGDKVDPVPKRGRVIDPAQRIDAVMDVATTVKAIEANRGLVKEIKAHVEIGALRPGMAADVSVFADERGEWARRDNNGERVVADRSLHPLFCRRAGTRGLRTRRGRR